MPMPTINDEKYNTLPVKLKEVNEALYELCMVITGGNFDITKIWSNLPLADPEAGQQTVSDYLQSLTVYQGLSDEIGKLTSGLPQSSSVEAAVKAIMAGMRKVIDFITNTTDELTGDRLEAFKRLYGPHPEGEYGAAINPAEPDQEKFGFFPAIIGVIESVSGNETSSKEYTEKLDTLVAYANEGEAVVRLVAFAEGTLNLLTTTLPFASN